MDQSLDTSISGIENRLQLFSSRAWQAVDYQLNEEGASVVDVTQDNPPITGDIKKGHVICEGLESSELAVFIANAPHDIGELLYNLRNQKRINEEGQKRIEGLEYQLKAKKESRDITLDLLKSEGKIIIKLQKKLDRLSPKPKPKKKVGKKRRKK